MYEELYETTKNHGGVHMNSLNENVLDFKSLEEEVYKYVCELGVGIIKNVLMTLDKQLASERDKSEYRHKGLKDNTIKTIMGPVEYKRAVYEHYDEEKNKEYVFLLDKFLEMDTIGKMSGMLVEKVLENATIASYRKSSNNVTSLTGQSISHGAAWNLVQKFGEKLETEENEKIEKFKAGELKGEREVEALFMESDGLWLSMQGKDRPKGKKGKKREIKIGIHYEGWVLRNNGKKKSYKLKNKRVVVGYKKSEEFKLLRDADVAQHYNYDEIKYKILNGDGAAWIKKDHDAEGEYFQLDRFHIYRAVYRAIKDKKEARALCILLRNYKFKSFMDRLEELKYECGGVYEEVKKIDELKAYLISNSDGIIPYQKRIDLPEPPEGLCYRNLGAMESNVFTVLGERMKKRRMSWSISGANNLGRVLAEKISGNLYNKISSLLSSNLPEKALEVYETTIKNVKVMDKKVGKKSNQYPVPQGAIPFIGSASTQGRKAIRDLIKNKAATELIYR